MRLPMVGEMSDLDSRLTHIAVDTSDHHEFRRAADEVLREVIPFDFAAWASMDPATLMPTSCDVLAGGSPMPHDPRRDRQLFEIEFADTDPFTFSKMAREDRRACRLRAEVEEPDRVRRYAELLAPLGIYDEMRTLVCDKTGIWGSVILYRSGSAPFEEEEAVTAESMSEALAGAFRHAFLVAAAVRPQSLGRPPGVLTLGEKGDIVETSETAERWLDTLPAEQVLSIFAALWARARGSPIARATVAGSDGPITFHAYPLKGSMEETAVVVERSRPAGLAEVIIAAHGLTPRETDVTRRVMHGLSTRLIARDLGMSEYTVQDHLRSVFAKCGVSSRAELMSTMYAYHYLPAIEQDATPGPYGWFLQP